MSDYGDEEFENYDDEGFEEEQEDEDYDVLPTGKGAVTPSPSTPTEVMSPARGPMRSSFTGQGHPAPSGGSILHRPAASVSLPAFAGLTDAEKRSAMKKLAGAIKRRKEIKLTVVVMEDFPQLQSLSKFELFTMGRSKYASLTVASSQTHADDKEEEAQTEEVQTRPYQCQVPEDRNTVFEGEHTLAAGSGKGSSSAPSGAASAAQKAVLRITAMPADQESKLLSFMRWAGPIVLAALGMNPTVKKLAINAWATMDSSGASLSAGNAKLQFDALLAQRPTTGTAFCPGHSPLLLAAYAPVGAQLGAAALLQDHTLNSKGVLCVWDLSATAAPHAVLVSEGSPTCCCWAPAPSTSLVFAGMEEGGVCAWDLEEPESRHPEEQLTGGSVFTRRPSYTTEYLADVATTAAPIVGIATTPKTESRSRPCQLVSLNGWGSVTVYTVVLMAPSERSAADADIGLRPGSRLKLVRTTQLSRLGLRAMKPLAPRRDKGEPPGLDQLVQTFSLQVLPGAEGQLLVGSDAGKVLRGSLLGAPPAPKEYVADDHKSTLANRPSAPPLPSDVTALHASPFLPGAFLSGHSNGSVALHSLGSSAAAAVWHDVSRGRILVVRWSPVRPAVFFALDSLCTLFTFDLTASRTAPVAAQSLMVQDKGKKVASLPTYFELGLVQTGEGGPGAKGTPCYCVAYDDGMVDVNLLAPKHCTAGAEELKVLTELVAASVGKVKGGGPGAAKPRAASKPAAGGAAAASPKPRKKAPPPPAPEE